MYYMYALHAALYLYMHNMLNVTLTVFNIECRVAYRVACACVTVCQQDKVN